MKRLLVLLTLFSVGQSFAQPITQTQYSQLVNQVATLQKSLQGPNAPVTQAQFQILQQYVQSLGLVVSTVQAPIVSPTTFYVDPVSGLDSNTCTIPGTGACLTLQGAYGKKSKVIQAPVTINLACGTYSAGFFAEGDSFIYNPANGPTPTVSTTPSLSIIGTEQNDTITSGLVTGTVASATQGGTTNTSTSGTITVTGAGWTVNDLIDRFVLITAGTDVGDLKPINANSATTLTVDGNWVATPDATSHYAIVKPCSVIQDGLTDEVQTAVPSISNSFGSAFNIRTLPTAPVYTPQIFLLNLNVQVLRAGSSGIRVQGPSGNVAIQGVLLTNSGGVSNTTNSKAFVINQGGAEVQVVNSIFKPSVNLFGVSTNTVINTVPATINTPTWSGWGGVDVRYSTFRYSGVTGSSPLQMVATRLGSWQNYFYCGANCLVLNGAWWQGTGDHFTVSAGGASAVASNGNTGIAGQVTAYMNYMTFVGGGAGTYALSHLTDGNPTMFCFNDANGSTTVSGFDIAYNFSGSFTNMTCFTPGTSGSVTADFQLGGADDTAIQFSVAQRNTAGYVFNHSSVNLVQ